MLKNNIAPYSKIKTHLQHIYGRLQTKVAPVTTK